MIRSRWHQSVARAKALAAEAARLSRAAPAGADRTRAAPAGTAPAGAAPLDVAWLAAAVGWLAEVTPVWEEMAGTSRLDVRTAGWFSPRRSRPG